MKVLFVDDETEILEQAEVFLEDEDDRLNIETVASAEKGLEILQEDDFDAIVSDYQMPEMNGLEFLETLREEKDSDLPFIIFTGKGREEIAMEALNLGANRYFQKKGSPRSQYEVLANTIVQEINHYRAEKEKERSREEWRKTFDALPVITALISPDHEIIRINKEGANRLGMNRKDSTGKKFYRVLHNKDEPIEKCPVEEVLEKEEPVIGKEVSENGRHYIAVAAPIKNESGEIESIALSMKDITERKKAEKDLQESEEKYRKLTEFSPNAIFLIDTESGEIIDVNRQALKLLDMSRENLVGMHHSELYPEEEGEKYGELFETYVPGKGQLRTMSMGRDDLYLVDSKGNKIPVNLKSSTFEIGNQKIVQDIYVDITERKKTEEELREREEYYRAIVETSPEAIAVTDLEGKIIDCNQKLVEMGGFDSEDKIIGKNAFKFIAPEDRERAEEYLEKTLEGDEVRDIEYTFLDSDGNEYSAELSASVIRDSEENPVSLMAVVKDITERKERKKELEKTRKSYQELFEKSADALFVHDAETGEVLDVNQKACDMYGVSKEDFEGEKIWEYSSGEHPYTQEEAVKKVNNARDGEVESFEWRAKKKSGELFWVEVNLKSIELLGEKKVIASVRDITERKEAEESLKEKEERLDLALEGSKAGLWDWHVQTGEVMIDERLTDMIGYELEELEPLSVEAWRDMIHSEDLKRANELLEEHFAGETDFFEFEGRVKSKEGDWVWIQVRAKVVEWDDEGNPVRMTGTHFEITERKEMEKELTKNKNRLEKIFESVEDGIIILDLEGDIVQVNEAAVDMVGYENREDLMGRNAFEFVHPEDREKAVEFTMKSFDEEEVYSGREYRVLTKNGEVIHTRAGSSLLYDDSGDLQGIVNVVRDITEEKKRRADKRKTRIVNSTIESIITDIVREFEIRVSIGSLGIKPSLNYLADLAIEPSPPQTVFDFIITGIQKKLAEKEVESSKENIRNILAPHMVKFFREIFPINKELGEDIPPEYENLKKELTPAK